MRSCLALCFLLICLASSSSVSRGQLSSSFYSTTCPLLPDVVLAGVTQSVLRDPRSAASLLRLFFHDCFVNGCDASVLLDDMATFTGEKSAAPNADSLRGFDVIDDIKSAVEVACPSTVSCADILALAARDSVVLVGGPSWTVVLGRRDATTASIDAANSNLPDPASSLSQLIEDFADKGLNARDMTALSGAHTFGRARCVNFRSHIYNDADIDPDFAAELQETCPASGDDSTLSPLDAQTADAFDNSYYQNLVAQQDVLVQQYAEDDLTFFNDFAAAMEKMGNISPLTGTSGEIRLNCRAVN